MCTFGWQMPFMGFPMGGIVSLLAIAALIAVLYKYHNTRQTDKSVHSVVADKNSSLHIVEMRLARGEISIEEFEKLKQVLHV